MATAPETILRETIAKLLPGTATVGDDVLTVKVVHMLTPPEKLPYPCWGYQVIAGADQGGRVLDEFVDEAIVGETIEDESHIYTTSDVYVLLAEKDVESVDSVTGTAAGGAFTFEEGVDFEVVDSDRDKAKDALKWLGGGTKPDNGTAVLVTYDHKLVERTTAALYQGRVIIHAFATDVRDEGHVGLTIVEVMRRDLTSWYKKTFRPAIEALGFVTGTAMERDPIVSTGRANTLQATSTFQVWWQEDAVHERVRTVRKVTATATVESA